MFAADSYREELTQVLSQAVIHLHNALGPLGTALVDRYGTLVFSNNALHYVSEKTLVQLAADFAAAPGTVQRHTLGPVTAITAVLDQRHMFVVVGKQLEDGTVNRFLTSLRQVLPPAPASV
ncbi:MAG: hypothetical protein IT324_31205 [Anaerolineae bacterium]|nr:hypothetical protein [Anaerolineae bacterium]